MAKTSASPETAGKGPLSQKVSLRQKHRLSLTPAMRMGLRVLALPTESLTEEILREAEINPCLMVESWPTSSAYEVALDTAAAPEGLSQSLLRQLGMQRLDADVKEAARVIVAELRADGYLDASLEELVYDYGIAKPLLAAALAAVQSCEPCGVGARNLAECLALQLRDAGLSAARAAQVVACLGDFAEGRWNRVMTALKVSEEEAQRIGALLRGLSPYPVNTTFEHLSTRVPEVVVERGPEGQTSVRLNPEALPTLSLAGAGSGLAQQAEQARRIVEAIAARQATLLRITGAIVDHQARFFATDTASMTPLSRADIARILGLHASTVGRALAGKALLFRGHVYPLSQFFPSSLGPLDAAVSSFDAQRRIRALVMAEDPEHPLADEEIRTQLKKDGVDMARRTVAKYRKCMRIPSSHERRRRKVSRTGRGQPVRAQSTP